MKQIVVHFECAKGKIQGAGFCSIVRNANRVLKVYGGDEDALNGELTLRGINATLRAITENELSNNIVVVTNDYFVHNMLAAQNNHMFATPEQERKFKAYYRSQKQLFQELFDEYERMLNTGIRVSYRKPEDADQCFNEAALKDALDAAQKNTWFECRDYKNGELK